MAEVKDGGPAFACVGGGLHLQQGMSLRDWFAGQALPGIIAACAKERNVKGVTQKSSPH